jgi:hypothetical protein
MTLEGEMKYPRSACVPRCEMITFLAWLLLFVLCWPLALFALMLYPIAWVLLLPFRVLGIAVDGVLDLLRAMLMLPGRLLGGGHPRPAA